MMIHSLESSRFTDLKIVNPTADFIHPLLAHLGMIRPGDRIAAELLIESVLRREVSLELAKRLPVIASASVEARRLDALQVLPCTNLSVVEESSILMASAYRPVQSPYVQICVGWGTSLAKEARPWESAKRFLTPLGINLAEGLSSLEFFADSNERIQLVAQATESNCVLVEGIRIQ